MSSVRMARSAELVAGSPRRLLTLDADPMLFNPYGIIAVNPAKHPTVNYILAMAYIGWVTSPEGQKIIRGFGRDKFGQPLFIPVAVPGEL